MGRKPIPIKVVTHVKDVGTHTKNLVNINNNCKGEITLPTGEVVKGRRKRFFGLCRYYDECDNEIKTVLGFLPTEWAYDPSEEEEETE